MDDSAPNAAACRLQFDNALEVIVADHCNLTCRQCNHASPAIRKRNLTADGIGEDLARLARHYAPAALKYIGGEPLLNPQVTAIVLQGRAAYPDATHWLVTNGTLLDRATDELWQAVDFMDVSIYPGQEISEDRLRNYEAMAKRFSTRLQYNAYPQFRHTYTSVTTQDEALIRDIFNACKIAHLWRCHALYAGRLYRCPQSIYAPAVSGRDFEDGLELADDAELGARLRAYLTSAEPLESCRNCLGTCGRKVEHAMLPRGQWMRDTAMPAEEMLDRPLMEALLREKPNGDDCRQTVADIRPHRASILNRIVARARETLVPLSRD